MNLRLITTILCWILACSSVSVAQDLRPESRWINGGFSDSHGEALFVSDSDWIITYTASSYDIAAGIRIWDRKTRHLLKYYPGSSTIAAVLDKSGKRVISGLECVVVTDLLSNNHDTVHSFGLQRVWITDYAFNKSGTEVYAGSYDTVYVWSYPAFKLIDRIPVEAQVRKLRAVDDSVIFVCHDSNKVVRLSRKSGKVEDSIRVVFPYRVSLDVKDSLLLINDGNDVCALYNWKKRRYVRHFPTGSDLTPQAAFSESGKYILLNSSSPPDSLRCYALEDYRQVWTAPVSISIGPVSMSPDDSTVLISGDPGPTRILCGKDGAGERTEFLSDHPRDVHFDPNSNDVIRITTRGIESANVWSDSLHWRVPIGEHDVLTADVFTPENVIVRGLRYGRLSFFDLTSRKDQRTDTIATADIKQVRYAYGGKLVIVLTFDKKLLAYDLSDRSTSELLADCLDFDLNDYRLWALTAKNEIRGFSTKTLSQASVWNAGTDPITAMAAGKDEDRVFVATYPTNEIRLVNTAIGVVEQTYGGHSDVVTGIAVSQDAKRVASIGYDSTLRTWSVGNGKQLSTRKPYPALLEGLEASHDGAHFALISEEGSLVMIPANWDQSKVHVSPEARPLLTWEGARLKLSRQATGMLEVSSILGASITRVWVDGAVKNNYDLRLDLQLENGYYLVTLVETSNGGRSTAKVLVFPE